MRHTLCLRWAGTGMLLGLAWAAWAQDPAAPVPPVDPSTALLLQLVSHLGLPGVMGWIAYLLARSLGSWTPTIRIELIEPPKKDD